MFPYTLDDIPHKWYKIEEARGHTFYWNEIKSSFLKNFEFRPEETLLQEVTREINFFLEKPSPDQIQKKGKAKVNIVGHGVMVLSLMSKRDKNINVDYGIDVKKINMVLSLYVFEILKYQEK
jgi:hypothetical protein